MMKKPHTTKQQEHEDPEAQLIDAFQLRKEDRADQGPKTEYHLLGPGIICDTGSRGYTLPHGRSVREIFVNAPEGFIPLWEKGTILHWRFQERSFDHFMRPEAAKEEIKKLLGDALMEWGTAAPVKFTEDNDLWDFEIVMRQGDECNPSGCVLASAFFPDSGRHELVLYPRMFTQSRKEQVDTFIHELGHVFGLRHFFADISETEWPAEHFGKRRKFSIMNYGSLSELTKTDKNDLTQLYKLAWKGTMTDINGTPIRFVKPYHSLLVANDNVFAVRHLLTSLLTQPTPNPNGGT